MKTLQAVYLSQEAFDKDLEECLTIITYPSKRKPFYVCEHISAALYKSKVNVYIKRQEFDKLESV
jgi:hypothetical protein